MVINVNKLCSVVCFSIKQCFVLSKACLHSSRLYSNCIRMTGRATKSLHTAESAVVNCVQVSKNCFEFSLKQSQSFFASCFVRSSKVLAPFTKSGKGTREPRSQAHVVELFRTCRRDGKDLSECLIPNARIYYYYYYNCWFSHRVEHYLHVRPSPDC